MNQQDRIIRANAAKRIMDDEVFKAAYEGLRAKYIQDFLDSNPDSIGARERAYTHLRTLRELKSEIQNFITDGDMASRSKENIYG